MKTNRITELIKKGYFIQNINYISSLTDEEFVILINSLPKTNVPKILKREDILEILNKNKTTSNKNIKIKIIEQKSKISITELLGLLRNRYIFLSSIIKKKLSFFNLLSINKISKKHKTFSIIGCVYKISDNKLTLDDFSSKIDIYVYNQDYLKIIDEDCVIGAKCHWENDKIVCEEIIFPEFEITNEEEKIKNKKEELKKIKIRFILQKILVNNEAGINNYSDEVIIFLGREYKTFSNNIVSINADIPVNQIFINDFLFLVIDKENINFDFEKFMKLRLVESKVEKILKFGSDIFLIENIPLSIILLNSDLNSFEERNNIFLINVSRNTKNFIIDFGKQSINFL